MAYKALKYQKQQGHTAEIDKRLSQILQTAVRIANLEPGEEMQDPLPKASLPSKRAIILAVGDGFFKPMNGGASGTYVVLERLCQMASST
ncbi:hypothetical protein BGW38_006228, partial [Lunasporangiospora selenospora]